MKTQSGTLSREVGLAGAVLLGLGSIVGTGVFVSIGVAAGIVGPAVILAIVIAAVVAACNALSSAQLAAKYPVSGGTYEYGYELLLPRIGFLAGWMFLAAKTASAATASLGFAGYLAASFEVIPKNSVVPVALTTVIVMTAIVAGGIRRSNHANTVIVSVTLLGLLTFCVAGGIRLTQQGTDMLQPFFVPEHGASSVSALFHAAALMFVAFTGYGRIATLGEEVHEPRRTIPKAIIITLIVSSLLYVAVATAAVGMIGAAALAEATTAEIAPLVVAARTVNTPLVRWLVSAAAITAMLGVLLNLILGLSRVLLAMARRGDMPPMFARVSGRRPSPVAAVLFSGLVIAGLSLLGDVKVTWSFSALTVLIYYAITNACALRLPSADRLYHPAIAAFGLLGCLGLAIWIEPRIWIWGGAVAAIGFAWHYASIAFRDRT